MDSHALIFEKLDKVQASKEGSSKYRDAFNDLASTIHKLFPNFRSAICGNTLHRKKLFVDSGLNRMAERAHSEIKKEFQQEFPDELLSGEVKLGFKNDLSGSMYRKSIYQFLDQFLQNIESRLPELIGDEEEIATNQSQQAQCQAVYRCFIRLMITYHCWGRTKTVNGMIKTCEALNSGYEEFLDSADAIENELKRVLAAYAYFTSTPTVRSWTDQVELTCHVMDYFREQYGNHEEIRFWKEMDSLSKLLKATSTLLEAYEKIKSANFQSLSLLEPSLSYYIEKYKAYLKNFETKFKESSNEGRTIDMKFLIAWRHHEEIVSEVEFLDFLLHSTAFKFLLTEKTLDADNEKISYVLQYFLMTVRFALESGCYLSSFGRTVYSLRDWEVLVAILNKLELRREERFLDLFANVPISSWVGSLLGARVYSVDMAFTETDPLTAYYRRKQEQVRYVIHLLRETGATPDVILRFLSITTFTVIDPRMPPYPPAGGPFGSEKVNPGAVGVFLRSHFLKVINNNPPVYKRHEYNLSLDNDSDVLNLEAESFDKALVDPPYGRETAKEGFGPEQALVVAKKAIRDLVCLLRKDGLVALTLPSLNWGEYPGEEWRGKILDFAESHGLWLLGDRNQLREGRALALLKMIK